MDRCFVCHLPLKDPLSVELGIGPECRRHAAEHQWTRRMANLILDTHEKLARRREAELTQSPANGLPHV